MDEDDFQHEMMETLAAGERNHENVKLIQNWCGNVRVERSGGIGMIEQMTGVPIGH